MANPELLAPLPLSNAMHPDPAGQSSSLVVSDATETDQLATLPSADCASQRSEKLQPKEHKAFCTEDIPERKKGERHTC